MPNTSPDTLNLTVTHRGKEWRYVLQTPVIQIGRGMHNDITLLDENVSRNHARLSQTASGWQIEDLGSANGTRLNGVAITSASAITEGDALQIGAAELHLTPPQTSPALSTQISPQDDTVLEATVIGNGPDLAQAAHEEPLEVVLPNTNIARLAIQFEGRIWEVPLTAKTLSIGRAPDNDIVLNHPKVSRHHAHIEQMEPTDKGEASVRIVDDHSANGTFIGDNGNAEKITSRNLAGSESIRIGPATLIYKPAFAPDALAAPSQTKEISQRKPIVFVPGFMGSQLWLGDKVVWPNLRLLMTQTDLFKLPETQTPLTVKGLVEEIVVVPNLYKQEQYSQLTDFLSESLGYEMDKDLLAFAYDWRKDLRLAAHQLKQRIDLWRSTLPDPTAKVIVIAHSMGCLVARYFLDVLGGDQMVERVILMGGPHLGTPKSIVALLTGKGVLPFGLMGDKLRDVVSTFPGAYQLLPIYPAVFDANDKPVDLFADPRWAEEPYRTHIEDARKFRGELDLKARVPTLCIVGYGNKTVTKVVVHANDAGRWEHIEFIENEDGDSTIPVSSAMLEGAEFHPVSQSHGALFVDNDVRFRLKLELKK